MAYTYYPGCAQEASALPYGASACAVCDKLGVGLRELDDWNCCGATAYMAVAELQAFAISARNLALAEQEAQRDIVTTCSGCFVVLNKANKYMQTDPKLKDQIDEVLAGVGLQYSAKLRVRHLLDVLVNDVGIDGVAGRMTTSLDGLKVAPYYGCQIGRPFDDFDDAERPMTLDRLLSALEATVVDYPLKATCCGGMLMSTKQDVCLDLVRRLIDCAEGQGAVCIATTCPLCHLNLEAYQGKLSERFGRRYEMPILYFTQLVGLALGADPKQLKLDAALMPVEPAVARYL
jgi:heterodisulfide reductase subunit B